MDSSDGKTGACRSNSFPGLVAHRGAARVWPENSLEAVLAAAKLGARFIEIDVQLTADLRPVLFHDDTLDRLCGVEGALHDYDWDALSGLTVRNSRAVHQSAPLVELANVVDALFAWPEVTLFVEVKPVTLARLGCAKTYQCIRNALKSRIEHTVLISFDLDFLLHARESGWPALGATVERWDQRLDPRIETIVPQYLFCYIEGLPESGPLAWPAGKLVIYEVADANIARALCERGVDCVETFDIAGMLSHASREQI